VWGHRLRARLARRAWIGIQDTPDDLRQWRGAIQQELGKQVTDNLKRLKEEIMPKVEAA
jgi:hypothetical protein